MDISDFGKVIKLVHRCFTLLQEHKKLTLKEFTPLNTAAKSQEVRLAGKTSPAARKTLSEINAALANLLRYLKYFLYNDAEELALRSVRWHWAKENQLHWSLNIGFQEDESRVREARSAENLATLRHIGINLLKQEKSCKRGIEGKCKKAGWDESYLLKVLQF